MRIVCVTCLKDNLADGGCYECCLCSSITSPAVKGVDLVKQLRDCCPLLYSCHADSAAETVTSRNCEFCEVRGKATHQCVDCAGLPLCAHHAEKHPKWLNFEGHVVEQDRAWSCAESGPTAPLTRCLLHGKHEIKLFCVTCGHGVCQQCVTRGHKVHNIQDVEQLVDRRRAILKSNNVHDAAADAIQMETMISQHVTEIGQDIDRLQHQSERASSTITDTFDEIEKMVRAKREGLLADIDKLAWRLTEPLEQKRRRLEMLNEQYTTAKQVATALASRNVATS